MKTVKNLLLAVVAAVALVAAAWGVTSCEQYVLPYLEISRDTIAVDSTAQETSLVIDTNVPWDFKLEDPDHFWMRFSTLGSDDPGTVEITIEENSTGQTRSVTIPVQTETLERQLYVVQSPNGEIPEP